MMAKRREPKGQLFSALTIGARIVSTAVLVASSVVLNACRNQQLLRPQDIRPIVIGSDSELHGLRDALKQTSQTGRPLRVLAVHGMLTADSTFSFKWQDAITQRLALVSVGDTQLVRLNRGYTFKVYDGGVEYPDVRQPLSEVRIRRWADPGDTTKIRLVFYEYLWAPLRDEIKYWFMACFELEKTASAHCPQHDAKPNPDKRAWLNRTVRDKLLTRGLADAAIVLGLLADVLRDDTDLALCVIANDVLDFKSASGPDAPRCTFANAVEIEEPRRRALVQSMRTTPFFALTHSLGGFFVMDGHRRARAQPSDTVGGARVPRPQWIPYAMLDTATVFMMANQVSLLELARLSVRCSGPSAAVAVPCHEARVATAGMRNAADDLKPRYVAFNDHNDILDFELPPTLGHDKFFGTLVNVSVRNHCGTYLFVFKNPGCAHVDYYRNPAVLQAIVEGFRLTPEGARP